MIGLGLMVCLLLLWPLTQEKGWLKIPRSDAKPGGGGEVQKKSVRRLPRFIERKALHNPIKIGDPARV